MFALVVLVVTTRVLGSEGRGIYSMVVLVVTVLKMASGLGIDVGNIYFAGRDRIELHRLVSNSMVFSVGLGSIAIVLFLVLLKCNLLGFLGNVPQNLLIVSIWALPFYLVSTFIRSLFLGKNYVLNYNLIVLAHPAIFSIVLVILLYFMRMDLSYVFCSSVTIHAVIGIGSVLVFRNYSLIQFRFFPDTARKTASYGLKAYLANIIQFLNYRFDFFLVNRFLDLKQVGYYSISVAMAEFLLHIPYAVGTVLFPKVSNSTAEEANRYTPIVYRHVFFLIIVSSVIFSLLAKTLFPFLFSEKFNVALTPFFLLLPGVVTLGMSRVIANDLAGRGKPIYNAYIAGITLVLNTALNIFLIPRWGIQGAAIASSITYSLSSIVLTVIFVNITRTSLKDLFLIRKSDLHFYRNFWNVVVHRK